MFTNFRLDTVDLTSLRQILIGSFVVFHSAFALSVTTPLIHERVGKIQLSDVPITDSRKTDVQNFIDRLPFDYYYGWAKTQIQTSKTHLAKGEKPEPLYTFFYGKRVIGQSPVFFLNGGPSTSSWSYAQNLMQQEGWKDQPFVFFDQAGTGGSSAYPSVDGSSSVAEINRLSGFGTMAAVDSIKEINALLQRPQARFRVFSHSFGGVIAMRLLEQPLHSHVIALLAHAPLPCYEVQPGETMRARLDAQIENWKKFIAQFPKDEAVPQAMLEWLNANPAVLESARQKIIKSKPDFAKYSFDSNAVVGSLAMELGSDFKKLDARLSSFAQNKKLEEADLVDLINLYLGRVYLNELAARDFIVHHEVTPGLTRREGVLIAKKSLPQDIQVISEVNVYPHIGGVKGKLDQLIMQSEVSAIDMKRASANISGKHAPKVTLYSYKSDSTVAPANVKTTVDLLGKNVVYKSDNEGGHNGFVQNQQALKDLIESAKLK